MNELAHIADQLISPSNGKNSTTVPNGGTPDIISEILAVDQGSERDTAKFAKKLICATTPETLENIWNFVKHYIKYQIDPVGVQFIKTPARIWSDRYADCKGYSIFIASLLKNIGYDFCYRFVSYGDRPIYTHVYIVVPYQGDEIVIDDVMPAFNAEKPYTHKKDIMTKIVRMSGIGADAPAGPMVKKLVDLGDGDLSNMSAGEMDLWIARDRLLTEKKITENMRGIGSLKAEKYQDSIDMIEDAILAVQRATMAGVGAATNFDLDAELIDIAHDAVTGVYSIANQVAGIGEIAGKAKREAKKAERKKRQADRKEIRKTTKGKERRKAMADWRKVNGTKTGKFMQKVGAKVKQGVKAIGRVLSAPQRLAMKGILEVQLPKAAPTFLYLFVTDPALIAKLPEAARIKRKKAEKAANIIIKGVGMKQNHFMGIVRNGIMKQMGDSPENIIAKQMKGQVSGIGLVEEVGKAAGGFLTKILDWIIGLFKKKKKKTPEEKDIEKSANEVKSEVEHPDFLSTFFPNPASPEEKNEDVADNIRKQPENTLNEDFDTEDEKSNGGGRSIWNSLKG